MKRLDQSVIDAGPAHFCLHVDIGGEHYHLGRRVRGFGCCHQLVAAHIGEVRIAHKEWYHLAEAAQKQKRLPTPRELSSQ